MSWNTVALLKFLNPFSGKAGFEAPFGAGLGDPLCGLSHARFGRCYKPVITGLLFLSQAFQKGHKSHRQKFIIFNPILMARDLDKALNRI